MTGNKKPLDCNSSGLADVGKVDVVEWTIWERLAMRLESVIKDLPQWFLGIDATTRDNGREET